MILLWDQRVVFLDILSLCFHLAILIVIIIILHWVVIVFIIIIFKVRDVLVTLEMFHY